MGVGIELGLGLLEAREPRLPRVRVMGVRVRVKG